MQHWIALAFNNRLGQPVEQPPEPCVAWALQFTPKVAWLEDCLVLEVQASARLFGGLVHLHALVAEGARHHGVTSWAWGRTALAACGQAKQQQTVEGMGPAPRASLARLPLCSLHQVARHAHALSRLGCHTLGDVFKLPREGLARRFGDELLRTLDQATGRHPQPLSWWTVPSEFDAHMELAHAQDNAPALMPHWLSLLQDLSMWLRTRHLGVCSLHLGWQHAWRHHEGGSAGQYTLRLSSPTQDVSRLQRLLAEHLARMHLSAPVSDVRLRCREFQPMRCEISSLFPEHSATPSEAGQQARRERWLDWMDRTSIRLGSSSLKRGQLRADHRIEYSQAWQGWGVTDTPKPTRVQGRQGTPCAQPSWLLTSPIRLPLRAAQGGRHEIPHYQGPLTLLAGPHRVESGWWDDAPGALVVRDYYLASSPEAGLLWIFQQRAAPDDHQSPWFLHGFFA